MPARVAALDVGTPIVYCLQMKLGQVLGVCSLSALASCWGESNDKPCNPRVEFGDELEVTVVGPWLDAVAKLGRNPFSPYGSEAPSCAMSDIKAGDVFTVRVEGVDDEHRDCKVPACPSDLPTASAPYAGSASLASATYICSSNTRKVQLSPTCEAARFVGLSDNSPYAYATNANPGPGLVPTNILTRGLQVPSGQGGQLKCDSPEQSFPAGAQDSADATHWRCSDDFVVDVRKK